jgi:hypothetical protein
MYGGPIEVMFQFMKLTDGKNTNGRKVPNN